MYSDCHGALVGEAAVSGDRFDVHRRQGTLTPQQAAAWTAASSRGRHSSSMLVEDCEGSADDGPAPRAEDRDADWAVTT
jgi:hypothetical protein